MERYTLSTSIDPIEVAFLRRGLGAAVDTAAVRAVERGALAVADGRLVPADPGRADGPFAQALLAVIGGGSSWSQAYGPVLLRGREDGRALERRLVAGGLLRESAPLRAVLGRCTRRGKDLLDTARRAYPVDQVKTLDAALALALYGPRALDGTPYAFRRTRGAGNGASDGGADSAFVAAGGHAGCGGHGGCGGSGCGSGGGCGGGGCGG